MASQSEADQVLREHRILEEHTPLGLQKEHAELEAKPFSRAEHRAHKRKLAAHKARLRSHPDRLPSSKQP